MQAAPRNLVPAQQIALRFVTVMALAVLLSGCGSTVCMMSKQHLHPFPRDPQPVYVVNPELKRELRILQTSGIFQLSNEPTSVRTLTLKPIRRYGFCANPLMLSGLTLGVLPGAVPGNFCFEYELKSGDLIERRSHRLPVYVRYSVWERLSQRDTDQVLGEALAWSVLERFAPDSAP